MHPEFGFVPLRLGAGEDPEVGAAPEPHEETRCVPLPEIQGYLKRQQVMAERFSPVEIGEHARHAGVGFILGRQGQAEAHFPGHGRIVRRFYAEVGISNRGLGLVDRSLPIRQIIVMVILISRVGQGQFEHQAVGIGYRQAK